MLSGGLKGGILVEVAHNTDRSWAKDCRSSGKCCHSLQAIRKVFKCTGLKALNILNDKSTVPGKASLILMNKMRVTEV